MKKTRVYVHVVGFSDVERHALNTLFRLSEERERSHVPWVPRAGPGAPALLAPAQVLLVDGESAEALLTHAREGPTAQRLIWVGAGAPAHAWRVLKRPMVWSDVLHDLDAVHAACQMDTGLLDLDTTLSAQPASDTVHSSGLDRRALLVGVSAADAEVLRSVLAQANTSEIDEVFDTDAAAVLMGFNLYSCAVFNLNEHQVDAWALAQMFRTRFPQAKSFVLREARDGFWDWWSERQVQRDSERAGVSALLERPLQARDVTPWIPRL